MRLLNYLSKIKIRFSNFLYLSPHPSARTLTLFTKTMPRNSQIVELAFKMPLVAKNNTSNACEKLSLKIRAAIDHTTPSNDGTT
jgi:hypothetical protein